MSHDRFGSAVEKALVIIDKSSGTEFASATTAARAFRHPHVFARRRRANYSQLWIWSGFSLLDFVDTIKRVSGLDFAVNMMA